LTPKPSNTGFFDPKTGILTQEQGFLTQKQGFLTQKQEIISKLFSRNFCEFEKTGYFQIISKLRTIRKLSKTKSSENSVFRRALPASTSNISLPTKQQDCKLAKLANYSLVKGGKLQFSERSNL